MLKDIPLIGFLFRSTSTKQVRNELIVLIRPTVLPTPEVAALCELLGFDPLYLANEGKLIAFVAPGDAAAVLAAVRADRCGRDAAIIGEVVADHPGKVFMQTRIGGTRIVDMLAGEQLPRIC